MRWLRYISLIAICLGPSTALAGKLAGVSLPDQSKVAGKTLVLNGMGMRQATVFKVDVYVAALYLESKLSDGAKIVSSAGPKKLILHFVRDVDADDLTDAFEDGFESNAGDGFDKLEARVKRLNSWMSDVKVGDELELTYLPKKGTEVRLKGKTKGVIPGDDFAHVLFRIWLGPNPPNSGLKTGLLGHSG